MVSLQAPESPTVREAGIQPLKETLIKYETQVGRTIKERSRWLSELKPKDFSQILREINGAVRNKGGPSEFDGKGVQAGTIDASIPPDQQDKEPILHYALTELQKKFSEGNISEDEFIKEAAVVLPTVANKLHLFIDGNGRTSRVLRMMVRDGVFDIDEKLKGIVTKDGFNR